MDWRAAWARLPRVVQWALAYVVLLSVAALIGLVTRIGPGNVVFLTGAAFILTSLYHIRLGGPKTRVGRDQEGRPLWGIDGELRRTELRKGLSWFSLGAAMWAALGVARWLA